MGDISLEGKVIAVTGASRGLGRAMAIALASARAKVVLASPETEALGQVVIDLVNLEKKCRLVGVDKYEGICW